MSVGMALHGQRRSMGSLSELSEGAFVALLLALFALSLAPFLLAPSLPLTFLASLPPFVLIYSRARQRRRKLASEIESESACLKAFVTNARIRWAELRASPTATIAEQEIIELVPEILRIDARRAKSLLEEISQAKLHILNAPRDAVLRPIQDELETRFANAQSLAKVSTTIGILGTFCGFIVALVTLSVFFGSMMVSDSAVAQVNSSNPIAAELITTALQNLAFSFIKSVYGLALASWITIEASALRKPMDDLYLLVNETLSFGAEFVGRMTLADPVVHSSLFQVRNALTDLHQRLFDHSEVVARSLGDHQRRVDDQTKVISSVGQSLVAIQANWDAALTDLNRAAEIFSGRTSATLNQIGEALLKVGEAVTRMVASVNSALGELSEASRSVTAASHRLEARLEKGLEAIRSESDARDKRFSQWADAVQRSLDLIERHLPLIEEHFAKTQRSFDGVTESNQSLTTRIGIVDDTLKSSVGLLRSVGQRPWLLRLAMTLIAVVALATLADIYVTNDLLGLKSFSVAIKKMLLSLP